MKIGKLLLVLCALAVPFTLSGCNTAKTDTADSGEHADDHDHDHGDHDHGDHDHGHGGHELGPHGGHLIELGEEKYHLEWEHDDEAKVLTFYVLDSEAKKDVPVAGDNITITVAVGEDKKDFDVPAVRADGEEKTAKFETKDADLFALVTDEDTKATVAVEIDGAPFEGEIEHHAH